MGTGMFLLHAKRCDMVVKLLTRAEGKHLQDYTSGYCIQNWSDNTKKEQIKYKNHLDLLSP